MFALPSNLLLSSLSDAARDQITSRAVAVALPVRTVLAEASRAPDYAYFLTAGIASVVTMMADGGMAEVGMIGREGVVGGLQVLGSARNPTACFMQMEGAGLRLPLEELRRLVDSSAEIRTAVLARVQIDSMVLAQVAGCHRLHEAEERLSRWLLMARDCVESDSLDFTQEFLAEMLGARRATVTLVAGSLQRAGLIEYRRGHVRIVDRALLETAACDCYRVIRQLNKSPAAGLPGPRALDVDGAAPQR